MQAANVESYSRLASNYDSILGEPMLRLVCRNFEWLRRRFGVRFESAADLGCGTGLFAAYLARRYGVTVTGVDKSPEMLAVARRRCAGLPVFLVEQDLRTLRLPVAVDLMTSNYDTLNHIVKPADLQAALRAMSAYLRPGGWLMADMLTPAMGIAISGRTRIAAPTPNGKVVQELRFELNRELLHARVLEFRNGKELVLTENHLERLYPMRTILALFGRAGLPVKVLRNAETLAAVRGPTRRVLVVAQKPF